MTLKETINLLHQTKRETFLETDDDFVDELVNAAYGNKINLIKYLCNALIYEHGRLEKLECANMEFVQANATLNVENETLKFEVSKLKEELEISNKALSHFNGHYVQRELVRNGHKPAYKEKVSAMEVKELLDKGYSITKIAETLGVSRGLVYRRIKELNKIKET